MCLPCPYALLLASLRGRIHEVSQGTWSSDLNKVEASHVLHIIVFAVIQLVSFFLIFQFVSPTWLIDCIGEMDGPLSSGPLRLHPDIEFCLGPREVTKQRGSRRPLAGRDWRRGWFPLEKRWIWGT